MQKIKLSNMISHKISLCFVFLFCNYSLCYEDEESTGKETAAFTCDASNDQCSEGLPTTTAAHKEKWEPFRFKATSDWISLDKFYPAYMKWHNKTLHDPNIPCERKKVLVFSPNAGLGDSIGALTSAFYYAIKTGRLFFIDWKPYHWTVGFKPLKFHYDYTTAKDLKDPVSQTPLLCIKKSKDPVSFMVGHVTNDHPIVDDPVINDYSLGADMLSETLLKPSNQVDDIVKNTMKGKNKASRMVGLVIRTGKGEYNQFLSEGDETNFVKCFRNYVAKKIPKNQSVRVFVTSDDAAVKKRVVRELEKGEFEIQSIDVVTLNDSIVHLMKVVNDEIDSVRVKIHKTFAEFFLIGKCQVLFLTHGSLFGRAAAERGKVDEGNIHYISDSKCDGKREKFSYLQCHEPKYPKVCGFS